MKDWYNALCNANNDGNLDNITNELVGMGFRPCQYNGTSCGIFVIIIIAYLILCNNLA